jgi:NADH-quinone oxidoreductase subunit C
MEAAQIFGLLESTFPGGVSDFTPAAAGVRDAFCKVAPGRLVEVCNFLKQDTRTRFDFLQCVTGLDYPREEKLVSVYHLFSYKHRHEFVLKVELPRAQPSCPSVTGIWKTANWNEREQYDLVGIHYTGHPDLRRLLMPDDWVGHPMRKDYKEADAYRGMATTRYSVLELLSAYDKEHPQTEGVRPRIVETDDAGPDDEEDAAAED